MPKSVSQLNPAEDPQDSDLVYVGQIARTPRDRKIGIAALARAFLHRALTHPVLSWVPGGDPVRVMARKGIGDANDQVGLLDIQTPFKDARTEVIRANITGTPATLTFDLGAHPGNAELFLTGADASPHLVLTNDITVGHTLKIRSAGVGEAVIVEFPAGTPLYYLQPTQTMVLARDAVGYMVSVEGVANLPIKTPLLGNESVKLVDIGGQWWRVTINGLRALIGDTAVDLSKDTTSGPIWKHLTAFNSSSTWTDATTHGWLIFRRTPPGMGSTSGRGQFHVSLFARFKGFSGSGSNSATAVLRLPESCFPSGWVDELVSAVGISTTGISAVGYPGSYIKNNFGLFPAKTATFVYMYVDAAAAPNRTISLEIPITWAELMPTDNTAGGVVQCDFVVPATDYPEASP